MEFGRGFFFVITLVYVFFQQVNSLKCYSCRSVDDPKCGTTWELSDKEAEKYIVNCTGDYPACKKIDTTDALKGKVIVTRSCWSASNSTDVEMDSEFLKCTSIGDVGHACYCTSADDKPCNGKQPTLTYISLIMAVFSVIYVLML